MAGNTRHVVNMANSIVGVSILSMPYCFKEAGLLLGVLMVLFSGVVTKKTCMFLVRAATMARHHSYEFLAFHVFGVRGKLAVELCMILFLIGICISFHVVMGDLAPALAAQVLDIPNTPSLRATLLLGIALLVVLPLCLLRKLDNLSSMSACSILFYFFLITVVFWHAFPRLVDGSWYHSARLWRPAGMLQVFPICMLGLSCQSNVFEIYDSVQDPDVPKMRSVVSHALNLCCALYISVGFFGYIAFVDQDIAGNVIMNLPATPLTEGIKLFFTASLAISFPLMIFPCRTSIHSLVFCRNTQGYDLVRNYMPEARFKGITVGILAVSLVVGMMIPNIEFVLGMLGSTMGVVISLVLPCVMFIKVNSKASVERLVAQAIMLMGVVLIVSGTYLNLTHTQHTSPQQQHQQQQQQQQPVIAMPPALLREDLMGEKEGDEVVMLQQSVQGGGQGGGVEPVPAVGVGREAKAAPPQDLATRREPVAPEPPPDEKLVPQAVPKAGGEVGAGVKTGVGMGVVQGDTLHPDAIQKEEKETHREGGGGGGAAPPVARVESKQQELLQKIEVQHQEQQKILAEQKQILQELKDQKAQQELAESMRAAAAVISDGAAGAVVAAAPQLMAGQLLPAGGALPAVPQMPPAAPQLMAGQLLPAGGALPAVQQMPPVAQQLPGAPVVVAQQPPAVLPHIAAAGEQHPPAAPSAIVPAAGVPAAGVPAAGVPAADVPAGAVVGAVDNAAAAVGVGAGVSAVPSLGKVSAAVPRPKTSEPPRMPHYPAPPLPDDKAKKGPAGYLEKVAKAGPTKAGQVKAGQVKAGKVKPSRTLETHHDEERKKRAVDFNFASETDLILPDLTDVGAGAGTGLSQAAFESRHLLWGNSKSRRRRRRGGQRGGDEEYWDET